MSLVRSTTLFALLLLMPALGRAATPTETGTSTSTPTATATVTPGTGSFSLTSYGSNGVPVGTPVLVQGSSGNAMDILYVTGEPWALGGGNLTVIFPTAMGYPNSSNFWVVPALASRVLGYSYSGQSVTIQLKALNQGETVALRYGQNATGFAVNSTLTAEVVTLYAYPQSVTLGAGGQVPLPIFVSVYSPTITTTITQTYTASPTFTVSPAPTVTSTATQTPDWTHTLTRTETPLGPAIASGVYAYPNPFNQRKYDKVTFRFPAASEAAIKVFNLVGEPVRALESADIQAAAGWAIWHGEDDYKRKVPGGLYYVRVKTPTGTYIKKFTVLY